ncbi:MAG: nicotinate phosphoribosyltransferase [Christensenellales bacterium]
MRNLTMLTDLYELTMLYGFYRNGMVRQQAVFDLFFRRQGASAYAVMAGLQQVKEYLRGLRFEEKDIAYLGSLGLFDAGFLSWLQGMRFTCDVDAVPEGTFVFPGEPLLRVKGPLGQAQLVETALLTLIGHQTLIATKANRIVRAAKGDRVMEFGLRRAQGVDAGLYGSRAAVIGGASSTSNTLAGQAFDIPVSGTHAHSWVMSFDSELAAFRAYGACYPDSCLLLVDTYDTLRSGVPNAIRVFQELRLAGHKPLGIRLDSGDLAYLSKKARAMLDEAGFPEVLICASNDLDEYLIRDLKLQGARIDLWGVGTKLITGGDSPALGGVYKMSALEEGGTLVPRMKLSDNPEKVTLPGVKDLYRVYDAQGMAFADLITLADEVVDESRPLTLFDPKDTWKRSTLTAYRLKRLLVPLMRGGEPVGGDSRVRDISLARAQDEKTIWDEHLRLLNPQTYKVDLSQKLWDLRSNLLNRGAQGLS